MSSRGRPFGEIVDEAIKRDSLKISDVAARAGITDAGLRKIIGGSVPNLTTTMSLLKALRLPSSALDECYPSQDPADIRREVLDQLLSAGVGKSKSELAARLDRMDWSTSASADDLRALVAELLQPFSQAERTWRTKDLKAIRTALIRLVEAWIEIAESGSKPNTELETIPEEARCRIVAAVLEASLAGQTSALGAKRVFQDEKRAFPCYAVTTKSYIDAHRRVLETAEALAEEQPIVVFGVTALAPSMWFESPLVPDRRREGTRHIEATEYRNLVERIVSTSRERVHWSRLVIAAESETHPRRGRAHAAKGDDLRAYGLYDEDYMNNLHRFYFVEREEAPGRPLDRLAYEEGLERVRQRFPDAVAEFTHRPSEPEPEPLVVDLWAYVGDEATFELGGDLHDGWETLDLLEGWRLVPLVRRFVESYHSKDDQARLRVVGWDEEAFVDSRKQTFREYVQTVGALTDVLLIGRYRGEPRDDLMIDWLFGLSGEMFWSSGVGRLQLLPARDMVQYVGEFWRSLYNDQAGGTRQWAKIAGFRGQ